MLPRLFPRVAGWIAALSPIASFASLLLVYDPQSPAISGFSWADVIGLTVSFRLDALSFFFASIITLIAAAVLVYADGYVREWKHKGGILGLLLFFEGAMLGLVLADNILVLYVFWELTTIASFLLIGIEREKQEARSAAVVALLTTSAGGLCLLASGLLLGAHTGTFEIPAIVAAGLPDDGNLAAWVAGLVAVAALTKSAQFPFHSWLPRAMSAPTPVSAYLHAATMVKAGIYLAARFTPVFHDSQLWIGLLGVSAAITMLIAAWGSLSSKDLKRLLAYTTIGALSIAMLLLAEGSPEALLAFILLVLAHAFYKACLFMCAGCVDHATGTRNLTELSGLGRLMPCTAIAAILGAISLAEFGPVMSYIAKEEVLNALGKSHLVWGLIMMAILAAVFVAAALAVARIFLGKVRYPMKPVEVSQSMWLPPLVLGLAGLPLAFASPIISPFIVGPTVETVGGVAHGEFKLWHGLNWKVAVSAGAVIGGILLFLPLRSMRRLIHQADPIVLEGVDRFASVVSASGRWIALRQASLLEHDRLPGYMLLIFLAVTVAIAPFLLDASWFATDRPAGESWEDVVLCAFASAGAFATLLLRSRYSLVASLSISGFSVALIFARYSAIDVAVAQILVEMFMVILLVGVLRYMPPLKRLSSYASLSLKAAVALAAAVAFYGALAQMVANRSPSRVSDFYIGKVAEAPHRENVVAAIIADFRALDTFGEITVLSVAAVGVLSMILLKRRREGRGQ